MIATCKTIQNITQVANKTDNTSLLQSSGNRRDMSLNNFGNMSFDNFREMLFKNHHEDVSKNNNNFHLLGELASSTPSVPSAMQTLVIMDSSVANLSNISLFVRICDISQHYYIPPRKVECTSFPDTSYLRLPKFCNIFVQVDII